MDIINLLKNFLSGTNAQAILPLLKLLNDNSFDIKKAFSSLTPEMLSPLLKTVFNAAPETSAPFYESEKPNGVTTIANIADSDIVYCLNRYVNANA